MQFCWYLRRITTTPTTTCGTTIGSSSSCEPAIKVGNGNASAGCALRCVQLHALSCIGGRQHGGYVRALLCVAPLRVLSGQLHGRLQCRNSYRLSVQSPSRVLQPSRHALRGVAPARISCPVLNESRCLLAMDSQSRVAR